MDTRTVVEHYFQCINSGRWDDYLRLFDDNIVMDEQVLGRVEGIEAMSKAIEPLRANPNFRNYPQTFVVEGIRAMVRWHIISTDSHNKTLDLKGVNYYEVVGGKIVYFANFHDTLPFHTD
ncbi:MAG: nuclear transport factor 2 family protein [Chloroflexaceae bacterium]|nr:nuclear transport factor 2 family protein [Chloroflexaceae bacterium]